MAVYFAYGSNMSSARLSARIGPVQALGAACASGWRLSFDKPGRDGSGKANLTPAAGLRAWGVAYDLPDASWSVLDDFEPGYHRRQLRLERPGGRRLLAQVYLYTALPGAARLMPSADYLAHLLTGAREHGLPEDTILRIRSALPGA